MEVHQRWSVPFGQSSLGNKRKRRGFCPLHVMPMKKFTWVLLDRWLLKKHGGVREICLISSIFDPFLRVQVYAKLFEPVTSLTGILRYVMYNVSKEKRIGLSLQSAWKEFRESCCLLFLNSCLDSWCKVLWQAFTHTQSSTRSGPVYIQSNI